MSVSLFLPWNVVEGNAVGLKSVDCEVGGEKNAGGTNNLVSHVTDLTPTLNGEHVSLNAGVNEDSAQWQLNPSTNVTQSRTFRSHHMIERTVLHYIGLRSCSHDQNLWNNTVWQ